MMKTSIDLNCDMAEYDAITQGANDAVIMRFVSSCNIACGAHAGNQKIIDHTVSLAVSNQVNIGAHPSYPDRINFGRQMMSIPHKELKPILRDQILSVKESVESQGSYLSHIKPHGALYNQAAVDLNLAILLTETVAEIDPKVMFYGLAHSAMTQAAKTVGIVFVAEGFADRAYTTSRTLQPRNEKGAVISDVDTVLERVLNLLKTGQMKSNSFETIELNIDTLCLHGDHEGAVHTAKTLHQGLLAAGFDIGPPTKKTA